MGHVILVLIDFSEVSDLVLAEAVKLGKALQSPIRLMHVAEPSLAPCFNIVGVGYGYNPVLEPGRELEERLDELRDKLAEPDLTVSAFLLHGRPVDLIVKEAERLDPELVILGSHGHGALQHLLAGSVCEGVLRRVACPVVIVPSRMVFSAPSVIQAAVPETTDGVDE